jgi:multiple sugar transport system permease protein
VSRDLRDSAATLSPRAALKRPTVAAGISYADRRRLFLVFMALPALAYVAAVGVWPIVKGIWFSLYDYSLLRPARTHFVGLGNYADVLSDAVTRQAFLNTVIFTVSAVAAELALGFAIALALWRDDRFNRICLALILIPVTITPLVVGLIFRALLMPDYGIVGYYLAEYSLSGPHGLFAYGPSALTTLIFIDMWEWTPLVAQILLAGLKALPGDILEAARADGATAIQRLRLVVIPLMAPTIVLAMMLRMIDAFRIFDSIYVTTGGGPGDATNSLMLHAVRQGLEFFDIGLRDRQRHSALHCRDGDDLCHSLPQGRQKGARNLSGARLSRLGERAFILAMTVFFLLPFLWLATAAYKPSRDMFSVPPTLLFQPTLEQFATVLRLFDVRSLLSSSLLIAAGSVGLSLLLGVPAGYALARSSSRYATAAAYFFMAVRMVPAVAALIPFYLMMRDVGLLGSWVSVVLINSMLNSAFVTWMMFLYFRGLPKELEEAALTDGCTMFGAFWLAALPAVRSGVVASALFCLIFSWNDFLYPMFLTRLDSKPLSVALLAAFGTKDVTWGALGALAHFSTIPIVLIVLVLNRYFVQGLTKGIH